MQTNNKTGDFKLYRDYKRNHYSQNTKTDFTYLGLFLIFLVYNFAGTPTTVHPSGTSEITNAPVPIFALFPIFIGPITVALAPI